MKHYSAAAFEQAARAVALRTESDLLAMLRRALVETSKPALAQRLGITQWRLSSILRGVHPLPERVAETLGFRPVTRFERMS